MYAIKKIGDQFGICFNGVLLSTNRLPIDQLIVDRRSKDLSLNHMLVRFDALGEMTPLLFDNEERAQQEINMLTANRTTTEHTPLWWDAIFIAALFIASCFYFWN